MSDKRASDLSHENVLRDVHSPVDNSLITNGFLVGAVGRKIQSAISSTNVPDDTQTLTFSDNSGVLYVLRIIYTDDTQATFISAERIA